MQLLLYYAITVLVSSIMMDLDYGVSIRDIANDGYTVIKNLYDSVYDDTYPIPIIIRLIPIANLGFAICHAIYQKLNHDDFFTFLDENNYIEPLTEREMEYFASKPTIRSAMKINKNREKYVNSSHVAILFDDSLIYFQFNQKLEPIIIRCEGPIASLNDEEKQKRFNHAMDLYYSYVSSKVSPDYFKEIILITKYVNFEHVNDITTSVENMKEILKHEQIPYVKENFIQEDMPYEEDKPKVLKRTKNNRRK